MLLTTWLRRRRPSPRSGSGRRRPAGRLAFEPLETRTLLAAAVTGTVFTDADGDGVRDAGEAAAAGVTVYADLDRSGLFDTGEISTATDANGDYALSGLAPGEYAVRAVPPAGFGVSGPGVAPAFFYAVDGTGSYTGGDGADNRLIKIDAAMGAVTDVGRLGVPVHGLVHTKDGRLFGISDDPDPDRFWSIDPATGAATLVGPAGAELARDIAYDAATDTIYGLGDVGDTGYYRLGTFDRATGAFAPVAGAPQISRTDLTGTPGLAFDPVNRRLIAYEFDGQVWEFTTAGAGRVLSTVSAGLGRSLAHDGTRFLIMADGAAQQQRLLVLDPDAGTVTPAASVTPSVAYAEALSYVASPGRAHVVAVADGQTAAGRDFGLAPNGGVVRGTVFEDRLRDGVRDGVRNAGEAGVGGLTVYLDLDGDGGLDAGEPEAVAAADGTYVFSDVAPGRYAVRQVLPPGFRRTTADTGNGVYYATDVTNRRLMRIDQISGTVTPIPLTPPAGWSLPALHGLASTNDGSLYALEANLATDVLWKVDAATGGLTRLGPTGRNHAWGMAYDPVRDVLYGVAFTGGRARLGLFNKATGAFHVIDTGTGVPSVGGANALTGMGGLAFDTDRRRLVAYDFHDGEIYSFALDGAAAKLSQTDAGLSGSLAYDGDRFVMEIREAAAPELGPGGALIALDPDAGSWSVLVETSAPFFEEALEYSPGKAGVHVVTVTAGGVVEGRDFGVVRPDVVLVDSLADEDDGDYSAGDVSLREALRLVVEDGDVRFAASLAGGTIVLGGTPIAFARDVKVYGLGPDDLTISGGGVSRVFEVAAGLTVRLSGVTVTGGVAPGADASTGVGGAILNHGLLALDKVVLRGNEAGLAGGAVYSDGSLVLSGCEFVDNAAPSGAAVRADGLTMYDTVVAGNVAGLTAAVDAGGLLIVRRSRFEDNRGASGGALHYAGSNAGVEDSVFARNVAASGGAIRNSGSMGISGSTFADNSAAAGGAVDNAGSLGVSTSAFVGNAATSGDGGAVRTSSSLGLTNVTASGNLASGDGGGISVTEGTATLRHVTVFGNRADGDGNGTGAGGGVAVGAGGQVVAFNTLVGGNVRGSGAGTASDVGGALAGTSSHNLLGDGASAGGLVNGVAGNVVGIDWRAVIDPVLRNNGGPTPTHALPRGSDAVDAGSNAESALGGVRLPYDQRGPGAARARGAAVDIGAFEFQAVPPAARADVVFADEGASVSGDLFADNGSGADSDRDRDALTVVAVNGVPAGVGTEVILPSGAKLTVAADGTFAYDPNGKFEHVAAGRSAVDTFTYTISDGFDGDATATVTVVIRGANDAPAAAGDAARINERDVAVGDVLANDFDADGDALTVSAVNGSAAAVGRTVTLASGARLRVDADGTYSYDPDGAFVRLRRGESAADSFTYAVSDGRGGTSTATVTVTVEGGGEDDLVGYAGGDWYVAASDGTAFATARAARWADAAWDALTTGDFDGDGRTDVLGLYKGAWYVGFAGTAGDGRTAFGAARWATWADLPWRHVLVGDVNGDGADDVVAEYSGGWYGDVSEGPRFARTTRLTGTSDAAWDLAALADVTGDGKADLVLVLGGDWYVGVSTGSTFGTVVRWARTGAGAYRLLTLADLDKDGRADAVGFVGGEWRTGLSNGTNGFATGLRAKWANVTWLDPLVGDFDGDGAADLAARYGGQWYVGLSSAAGGERSRALWATWNNLAWKDVRAGDFDGDGRSDVAGRYDGGWYVARSTGSAFATSLWGRWGETGWRAVTAGDADGAVPPVSVARVSSSPTAAFTAATSSGMLSTSVKTSWALRIAPAAFAAPAEDEPLLRFWSAAATDEELATGLLGSG